MHLFILDVGNNLKLVLLTAIWVGGWAWLINQWWVASAAGRLLGGRK
jgi:hypothetical protein